MTVKKKVEENDEQLDSLKYEVISRGGHVKEDDKTEEWVCISLRISKGLLERISGSLFKRIGLTRNAWILEAIQEKLGGKNE